MNQQYKYIGPEHLLAEGRSSPGGIPLRSAADIHSWLLSAEAEPAGARWPATYIVSTSGTLKFASRRSEHVSCASGQNVLAAGEIFFGMDGTVVAATNQSTGYCPRPDCWPHVRDAIERAGLTPPQGFETEFHFRRCPGCGERNLVREEYFVCSICDSDLPLQWNFLT